jgi:steroid delta-isomerase-like uncharacterized protein
MTLSFAVVFCFVVGCQDKAAVAELEELKAQATLEEKNMAVVRQFHEAVDSQDIDAIIEFFAPGGIGHGAGPHEEVTAENAAQFFPPFFQAFPNMTHNIQGIFAKGDMVTARILIEATHEGDLMGIPATGKKLKFIQIAIFQIADGKIKESWRLTDSLGMMQQLGMELKPMEEEK